MQGEPTAVRVGTVTAVAWPAERRLATALAQQASQPVQWPGLDERAPGPLKLIVVPDARRLAELTGGRAPEWGVAIALPGARTIVIRADAGDLPRTLRHELAHLALHEAIDVRVPLWFDEGYASWAAGELERLDALQLNLAVLRGAVPDLDRLDEALRGAAPAAEPAYALAASAVLELARRHPDGSIRPLMQRLVAGVPFDSALTATTGLTRGRFEIAWRQAVRRRYGVLTWLLAGGIWLVFAVAVLGLAALRRRRDRGRRAALDEGWIVAEDAPDEPEDDAPPDLDRVTRG